MTGNENFESRLLTELRQVSAENPSPAAQPTKTRPYGRVAVVGAGLAAVVAGIAIYTSTGDNTSSAYAVEQKPDGMVTVKIKSLKDADGLETSLNEAGVPAVVNYTPIAPTSDCGVSPATASADYGSDVGSDSADPSPRLTKHGGPPATASATEASSPADGKTVTMAGSSGPDGTTFSIDPGTMKPGEKVYITTSAPSTAPAPEDAATAAADTAAAVSSVAVSIGDKPATAPAPGC